MLLHPGVTLPFLMNFLAWNIKRLDSVDKAAEFRKLVNKHNIDWLGITKTKSNRSSINHYRVANLWGNSRFQFIKCLAIETKSRGFYLFGILRLLKLTFFLKGHRWIVIVGRMNWFD